MKTDPTRTLARFSFPLTLATTAALLAAACSSTIGDPLQQEELGYRECDKYYDCGTGRYCTPEGFCWSDCRSTADCALLDSGELCNLFGECVDRGGTEACTGHASCPEGTWCNGRCGGVANGSLCSSDADCDYFGSPSSECLGTCAPQCATDNDCIGFGDDLECTPVGQCLIPGWEQWIPPGELPPTSCTRDSQCVGLGWNWVCDCNKALDPFTGLQVCAGEAESLCTLVDGPIDYGAGPADRPAHAFTGVWGMRMEIATVTLNLPLVSKQNTYSSNLVLIKASHPTGATLVLEEKLCDIKLLNFVDSDEEFTDLAWMVIPNRYLVSLPILTQTVQVASTTPGSPFETSQSIEVRGCVLADPVADPLPTKAEYQANPADPRLWDEDEDGHTGMTTLMDGVLRGAIYNVQRWKAVYHGHILDSDHVKGLSTIDNEQVVISASNPTLDYDAQTVMHDMPDRTYFRLERLSEDASCADLIRLANRDNAWLRHTPHLDDVPDP